MKYYVRSPNGEGTFGVMKVIDPHKPPQYVSLADDIEIQNAYRDIDNADVSFDVIIDDETIRLTFNDIDDITNVKGYALHSGNKKDVMNYLRQQYKDLLKLGKVKRVYNDIGWNNGTFRGYSANTPKGTAYYNGIFALKPHGTKTGFIADLQKSIIGHTELELSVILGLSACTIGFLKTKDVVLDSLVVNIYGTSTTGKTTGAKLAISMGGSPQNTYKQSSLARTCSTTQNALIAQLRGNSGYPVLFDELGMLDKRVNIPQLVFDIATGSGKQRLNAACKFHFDKSWATTIIFTGEASLLEGQKVVDGINMRVLTFDNAKWTVSAKQAHEVEQFSKAYSGLPITLLAEFINSYKTK
ncbi:MAG: DUF927 domain-containing protein [Ruminiclostridium sp.]|nr:DUF927 domain-containing protein [Ruminiclostridium sp.]